VYDSAAHDAARAEHDATAGAQEPEPFGFEEHELHSQEAEEAAVEAEEEPEELEMEEEEGEEYEAGDAAAEAAAEAAEAAAEAEAEAGAAADEEEAEEVAAAAAALEAAAGALLAARDEEPAEGTEAAGAAVAAAAAGAAAALPKPSGLGIGGLPPRGGAGLGGAGLGGPKLPARPSAGGAEPKPADAPAPGGGVKPAGLGGLGLAPKPKPAGGLPSLPPRGGGGAAPTSAAATQAPPGAAGAPAAQQQQAKPEAAGAAAAPSLPARPTAPSLLARPAGGLGGLPARPAPAAGAAPPAPAPAARPALPARPGALVASGAGAPAAVAAPPSGEAKKVQKARRELQDLRVNLIRGAGRLGMPLTGDAVSQFLKVVDRIEELQLPGPGRRADAMRAAYSEASVRVALGGGSWVGGGRLRSGLAGRRVFWAARACSRCAPALRPTPPQRGPQQPPRNPLAPPPRRSTSRSRPTRGWASASRCSSSASPAPASRSSSTRCWSAPRRARARSARARAGWVPSPRGAGAGGGRAAAVRGATPVGARRRRQQRAGRARLHAKLKTAATKTPSPAPPLPPKVRVLRGDVRGIGLTCIDTPGLHASSDSALANRGVLRAVARAYKKHKPDFVLYVDRWGRRGALGRQGRVRGPPEIRRVRTWVQERARNPAFEAPRAPHNPDRRPPSALPAPKKARRRQALVRRALCAVAARRGARQGRVAQPDGGADARQRGARQAGGGVQPGGRGRGRRPALPAETKVGRPPRPEWLESPRPGARLSRLTALASHLNLSSPPHPHQTMKQRRNILGNIMRQVSGEMQLKTPSFLADAHPEGPR
jgi:hypothetical protein